MTTSAVFYVDESGDLGWTLDRPYRQGGSSRYLTVAALGVTSAKRHLPKRAIRRLYRRHAWSPSVETKWADMGGTERLAFAQEAARLARKAAEVRYYAITVQKDNVQPHIQADANKLYNYMIRLLLLEEMAKYDAVTLVPDARSIKVRSGNSLHDYLQTELWFTRNVTTVLHTLPSDSVSTLNLQFVDMLAGLVASHHEDARSDPWKILRSHMGCKTLFFR